MKYWHSKSLSLNKSLTVSFGVSKFATNGLDIRRPWSYFSEVCCNTLLFFGEFFHHCRRTQYDKPPGAQDSRIHLAKFVTAEQPNVN